MSDVRADRSRSLIIETLAKSPVPMTRTALASKTGLSYNTIKTHVDTIGARVSRQGSSEVYSFSGSNIDSGITLKWTSRAARKSGMTLKAEMIELPDTIGTYEKLASRIPLALPARIKPDDDPADLAEAIEQYAVFLASVAAKLHEQQDNPAWFRTLGGDDGYFDPNTQIISKPRS